MKTKLFLILSMFFVFMQVAEAQHTDTTYYEDYDSYDDLNFSFGLPSAEVSTIMDRNVFSMGATLSFYVKKHWRLGFYGQRLSTDFNCPLQHDTSYYDKTRLGYGHIGVDAGYVFFPEKKIHVTPGIRMGWGHISFSDDQTHINNDGSKIEFSKKIEKHQLLVVSPCVQLDYAISPNIHFGLCVGYRKNMGFSNLNYSDKDFDGAFAALSILFGNFAYPKFE